MQLPPEATSISIEVKPQPAGGDPDTTHCGAFWANAGAAAATTNPSAATIRCSAQISNGVHDDVAKSLRKHIPTCSARYAISAEVDCDLLALVKTISWTQRVRPKSALRPNSRKGSETGANLAVCGYYCTATTAPQRYFSELARLSRWTGPIRPQVVRVIPIE
jgi:hypothetical protein